MSERDLEYWQDRALEAEQQMDFWRSKCFEAREQIVELRSVLLEVRSVLERWNGCSHAPWWKKYLKAIGEEENNNA